MSNEDTNHVLYGSIVHAMVHNILCNTGCKCVLIVLCAYYYCRAAACLAVTVDEDLSSSVDLYMLDPQKH